MQIIFRVEGLSKDFINQYYQNWVKFFSTTKKDGIDYCVVSKVFVYSGANHDTHLWNVSYDFETFPWKEDIPAINPDEDYVQFTVVKKIKVPVFTKVKDIKVTDAELDAAIVLLKSLPVERAAKAIKDMFDIELDLRGSIDWYCIRRSIDTQINRICYKCTTETVEYPFTVTMFKQYSWEERIIMDLMGRKK